MNNERCHSLLRVKKTLLINGAIHVTIKMVKRNSRTKWLSPKTSMFVQSFNLSVFVRLKYETSYLRPYILTNQKYHQQRVAPGPMEIPLQKYIVEVIKANATVSQDDRAKTLSFAIVWSNNAIIQIHDHNKRTTWNQFANRILMDMG